MTTYRSAGSTENRISSGAVEAGFEPVKALLDRFLLEDETYSAQLCVYWHGRPVIDLWGGPDIASDSLTGVFSVSKGVSALCIAAMLDRGDLDLDQRVAHYWPEFAAAGKEDIPVRDLLSHQVGLFAPAGFGIEDYLDSRGLAEAIAASPPSWRPGKVFGYHALTIGVFMEELVRRVYGTTLQELYAQTFRHPYKLDFFLGLPEEEESRYRDQLPLILTPAQQAETQPVPGDADGLSSLAFSNLDPQAPILLPNRVDVRRAGPSAVGGVGNARGLATVYASAATGIDGMAPLIREQALRQMAQEQVYGFDRILQKEMAFGIVFMKPQPKIPFASHAAFGHDGAGGALGYADPMYNLAFGYIPQRMSYPGDADSRFVQLSTAVRRCVVNLGRD